MSSSINYELACALRDAGFPQSHYMNQLCKHEDYSHNLKSSPTPDCEWVSVPSLEELIEACGERFGGLVRLRNGMWNAATPVIDTGMSYGNPSTEVEATTPTEAVACLWLALNKKDL